jgi:hypothetical protein
MDEKRDDTRPGMPAQPADKPVERTDVQPQGAEKPATGAATPHMPMPAGRPSGPVLIDGATMSDFERRWESVQGEFVDDPRRAVAQAGSLVSDLLERMRSNLSKRGSELGREVSGDPDTEAMRIELRQYKAVFRALLHGDEGQPKAPPRAPAPPDRRPSAMNG